MHNKLVFTQASIEVHCDRNDTETHQLCSQFYPVHKNRINTLFKISLRQAPEVLKAFRHIDYSSPLELEKVPNRIVDKVESELYRREILKILLEYGATSTGQVNSLLTLDAHQQLGREIAKVFPRFGFFYDTRTGKTPMSLTIMNDDIKANPDHKWLVVCPLILVTEAWLDDASKFFPDLVVQSLHASTKDKRLKMFEKDANIYIMNTESFVAYKEYIYALNIYGCFVDESSTMKSHRTKQSEELCLFSETVQRWYLLTGTPAPNGEYEYYMQLRSIDKFCVSASYTAFKEHFFIDTSFNSNFEKLALRPDMKEELYALLRRYSLFVDKEDVLDTPGRRFDPVLYDLDDETMKFYKEMQKDMCIEIANEQYITANAAATKINKLNQISSGFVFDTDAKHYNKSLLTKSEEAHQEIYELSNKRFEVLKDLLDTFGKEQVLIWANYRWEFMKLQELFGDNCRCIYGATSIEGKKEAIQLFKANKIQYLCANPASADKGLTLTNAHLAVYFSLSWSYELYKQSMERIYGGKRIQPLFCNYYIIMAKGTVDEVLYNDVLTGKASTSMALLNHLKGGINDKTL